MFILRLISQPKVERNLLDKYHISNLRVYIPIELHGNETRGDNLNR